MVADIIRSQRTDSNDYDEDRRCRPTPLVTTGHRQLTYASSSCFSCCWRSRPLGRRIPASGYWDTVGKVTWQAPGLAQFCCRLGRLAVICVSAMKKEISRRREGPGRHAVVRMPRMKVVVAAAAKAMAAADASFPLYCCSSSSCVNVCPVTYVK